MLQRGYGYFRDWYQTIPSSHDDRLLTDSMELRGGQKWEHVFEPVLDMMLYLCERDHAFVNFMAKAKDRQHEFDAKMKSMILDEKSQTLRGICRFERDPSTGYVKVVSLNYDEERSDPPLDKSVDAMSVVMSVDMLTDGSKQFSARYMMNTFYEISMVDEALRRWQSILQANVRNDAGLFASFSREMPHVINIVKRVVYFDARRAQIFSRAKHANQHPDIVNVDLTLPWNRPTLKTEYPELLKSIDSMEVEIVVMDPSGSKVGFLVDVTHKHVRIRGNLYNGLLVWNDLHHDALKPRLRDGVLETIDIDRTRLDGGCLLIIKPNAHLPLNFTVTLPLFHVAVQSHGSENERETTITARIVHMEKRFLGKAVKMFMPGLSGMIERFVETVCWTWTLIRSDNGSPPAIVHTVSYNVLKPGRILKKAVTKMVEESYRPTEVSKESTNGLKKSSSSDVRLMKYKGNPEDRTDRVFSREYLSALLHDLNAMARSLYTKKTQPV